MIARIRERLPKLLFLTSLVVLSFGYGFVSHRTQIFPYQVIQRAEVGWNELRPKPPAELPFHLTRTTQREPVVLHQPEKMAPGLTMISRMGQEELFVDVVDRDGNIVHRWELDWFEIWPDAKHLPDDVKPRMRPGTHLHGILLMPDGDLIFNYEEMGMVRVDVCGHVKWKLAYRTHHSLHLDDHGHIWAPGMKTHFEPVPRMTYYQPRFEEQTVIEVVPDDGRIVREISLFDLFKENELQGLLYQWSPGLHPTVTGDALHLNDVEVFSRSMDPGFFQPGDVMMSLRNINAIVVFDGATMRKKFVSIGPYVRQHDPDFIDGNTISIFDNNDVAPRETGVQSRIIRQTAPDGEVQVAFAGGKEAPFFTDLLGSHEWLDNGNLLIAEGRGGRAFEVDPEGRLVWEFYNIVDDGVVALLETAHRLPPEFTAEFFAMRLSECVGEK